MKDLDPELFGRDQPCFGCSPTHPIGFRLRFAQDGDQVVTRFTPGEQYQGPPGVMHGGLVTAVADELAAWALIANLGKFGFTASMEVRLARPVRIGVESEGRSRIVKASTRIVRVEAIIRQGGEVCYTANMTFVLLDRAGAEKLIGGPLPESWSRWAR
jgi:acyl-coenzyme A thioesterase PaaI-like protein